HRPRALRSAVGGQLGPWVVHSWPLGAPGRHSAACRPAAAQRHQPRGAERGVTAAVIDAAALQVPGSGVTGSRVHPRSHRLTRSRVRGPRVHDPALRMNLEPWNLEPGTLALARDEPQLDRLLHELRVGSHTEVSHDAVLVELYGARTDVEQYRDLL